MDSTRGIEANPAGYTHGKRPRCPAEGQVQRDYISDPAWSHLSVESIISGYWKWRGVLWSPRAAVSRPLPHKKNMCVSEIIFLFR